MLHISDIHKYFSGGTAVAGLRFDLASGEILSLLGPSGCGKTTLLRIIAGLEEADRGKIFFDGRNMADVPPHKRRFGMMFQDYALFPHKNVRENIAFGLKMQGTDAKASEDRVAEMLTLVGLEGFGLRRVDSLSGGERQRVALARSLAPSPRLLMLDEPLGALDRALRERLMEELRRILKHVGVTAVYVTHDQAEAFAVADRIAVMDKGRILQIDRPEIIYRCPADAAVARFLGFHNLLDGTVTPGGSFRTDLGGLELRVPDMGGETGFCALIRPESGRVASGSAEVQPDGTSPAPPADTGKFLISGRVRDVVFLGAFYRLRLEAEGDRVLVFHLPAAPSPPAEGAIITVETDISSIRLLPK